MIVCVFVFFLNLHGSAFFDKLFLFLNVLLFCFVFFLKSLKRKCDRALSCQLTVLKRVCGRAFSSLLLPFPSLNFFFRPIFCTYCFSWLNMEISDVHVTVSKFGDYDPEGIK